LLLKSMQRRGLIELSAKPRDHIELGHRYSVWDPGRMLPAGEAMLKSAEDGSR
jgi:hypothetical protein